ncbi:hypothetical protein JCM10213_005250 [Rhodosporidiobolus nylandii]
MVSSTPSFTRLRVSPVDKGRAIGQRIRGNCVKAQVAVIKVRMDAELKSERSRRTLLRLRSDSDQSTSPSTSPTYLSFASLGIKPPVTREEKQTEAESEQVETASTSSNPSTDSILTTTSASTAQSSLFSLNLGSLPSFSTLATLASFFSPPSSPTTEAPVEPVSTSTSTSRPVPPLLASVLSSSRIPSTAVSCPATYVDQAREFDVYDSLELLHAIWDEAHPWQLTGWDGEEVVIHVPRALAVYRLKKTIRRKYFLGGRFYRSYPVNLYCNNHVPVTPCPSLGLLRLRAMRVNYQRLRDLRRAYPGAVKKAVVNGELVEWAFDGQLDEDD